MRIAGFLAEQPQDVVSLGGTQRQGHFKRHEPTLSLPALCSALPKLAFLASTVRRSSCRHPLTVPS